MTHTSLPLRPQRAAGCGTHSLAGLPGHAEALFSGPRTHQFLHSLNHRVGGMDLLLSSLALDCCILPHQLLPTPRGFLRVRESRRRVKAGAT